MYELAELVSRTQLRSAVREISLRPNCAKRRSASREDRPDARVPRCASSTSIRSCGSMTPTPRSEALATSRRTDRGAPRGACGEMAAQRPRLAYLYSPPSSSRRCCGSAFNTLSPSPADLETVPPGWRRSPQTRPRSRPPIQPRRRSWSGSCRCLARVRVSGSGPSPRRRRRARRSAAARRASQPHQPRGDRGARAGMSAEPDTHGGCHRCRALGHVVDPDMSLLDASVDDVDAGGGHGIDSGSGGTYGTL